ncbi:MAG: hypothetical protein EP343_18375 [Deltaproteobacteria bacterium]|nr:MAG: hypothetical protein EP343_18375 [Deltaproteobacteria bacterium]
MKTMKKLFAVSAVVCLVWGMVGCGGGQGTLKLTVWGEEFVEDKIPASEVEDGWEITFTRFLIVVGQAKLATRSGTTGPDIAALKVFDLKQAGKHTFMEQAVEATAWDNLTYKVAPATSATEAGNASAADLKLMQDNGYSIYLEGKATKENVTKTFAWGFKTDTTYAGCESKAVVSAGSTATAQFTIHADHFFYDDLESNDAKVRFDAIAQADKNDDGVVTVEELAGVSGAEFAGLSTYGVGRFSEVKDLHAFVTQLSKTLGHIDGEGHCNVQ